MLTPNIDPADYDRFPVFRETFLLHFTQPGDAAALRQIGHVVFLMVNEYQAYWPDHRKTYPRPQLRAALADLRHLEGYLGVYLDDYPVAMEAAGGVRDVADRLDAALRTRGRL
jgi:hypothetical protein